MHNDDSFDLQGFLPYLLAQAAETASAGFQRHYKDRYGMLRTEWRVLFHLGRYGPMTAKDIGARARVHKTKISRAVAALETKRFLTRNVVTRDRRQAKLDLTKNGQAAFDDLYKAAQAFDAQLMAGFSRQEGAALKRCLAALAAQ
ncbi:MarR family winged helix-turn-helix transcriptional regulator [Yoonia sp.]|uniref:MarR family winged helix-turn-helix transcriptional regulator n=1 Tax=Yoonia sp. TaxID=2212373 RepID=UPI0019E7A6D7|nr:MarR family transcriptional regulator [Yoonia sp.]MBE0413484.1 MarR family transcriptional regulator [Yoonia sp.]